MTEPASKELRKEIAAQAEAMSAAASELIEREGRKYLIRPVTRREMAASGMRGPLLEMITDAGKTDADKERAVRIDLDKWTALQESVVACGLTAPEVWAGPELKRPPGQVLISTLHRDMDFIYNKIMSLSGYTVEAAQAVSFPDTEQVGTGNSDDRPGGGDAPEPSGSVAPRGVGV